MNTKNVVGSDEMMLIREECGVKKSLLIRSEFSEPKMDLSMHAAGSREFIGMSLDDAEAALIVDFLQRQLELKNVMDLRST